MTSSYSKEVFGKYEYLDHPADIQLHSWGSNLEEALENVVLSMYGYMTDLSKVEEVYDYHFHAQGRDLQSLVFAVLDETLVAFQSEPFFVGRRVKMLDVKQDETGEYTAHWSTTGDSFDLQKHPQEADVKAITYSNMQVRIESERCDIFVIVDI